MENSKIKFRFNIDRGGTFTDIYCEYSKENEGSENKQTLVYKLLSQDPQNYEDAPSEGIRRIISEITKTPIGQTDKIPTKCIESIRMGTTIATNALLERKGERCALLITEGFKDLLEIGNQTRPKIFDLKIERFEKIYELVCEVNERVRIIPATELTNILTSDGNITNSNLLQNCHQGVTGEWVEILKPLDEDEIIYSLKILQVRGLNLWQ